MAESGFHEGHSMQTKKTAKIGEGNTFSPPTDPASTQMSSRDTSGAAKTTMPLIGGQQPPSDLREHAITDPSLIAIIAAKIVSVRFKILPHNSRRERLYTEYIRPLLVPLLARQNSDSLKQKFEAARVETIKPPHFRREDVREILIIKCDHIGDFFLSLQAFSRLKQGFPDARLTLLCGPWNKDLARESGLFDDVVCVEVFPTLSGAEAVAFDASIIDSFNFPHFDIAVDLRPDGDTSFLLDFVRARLKARFKSFDSIRAPSQSQAEESQSNFVVYTPHAISHGRSNHARHTRGLLAQMASALVDLFVAQEETVAAMAPYLDRPADRVLTGRGRGPLIGISTGAGGKIKAWPLENYISLIRSLIAVHDATIVLLGGPNEKADGEAIAAACPNSNIIDLNGATALTELPRLIRQVDLYIGHDTGGTHIASSMGQKTLCLHAGTSPLETFGPVGKHVTILKCVDLPCAPCGLIKMSACRHGHQCMVSIKPERVIAEVERILDLQPGV